jgi:bifunctional ADP-heptose synthase (sugar kinase/adenylyltransferase)
MGKAGIGRLWVKSRGGVGAMILNFDDLKAHLGRVAMVDGAFDPVHSGHVAYFEAAALLGVPVLCNPASDRYVEGKHAPVLPQASALS